jgi:hypothetical protein
MIGLQSSVLAIVPKGHLKIAQHFSAGYHGIIITGPEGTAELLSVPSLLKAIEAYPRLLKGTIKNHFFGPPRRSPALRDRSRPVKPSQGTFKKLFFWIRSILSILSKLRVSPLSFRKPTEGYRRPPRGWILDTFGHLRSPLDTFGRPPGGISDACGCLRSAPPGEGCRTRISFRSSSIPAAACICFS